MIYHILHIPTYITIYSIPVFLVCFSCPKKTVFVSRRDFSIGESPDFTAFKAASRNIVTLSAEASPCDEEDPGRHKIRDSMIDRYIYICIYIYIHYVKIVLIYIYNHIYIHTYVYIYIFILYTSFICIYI